MKFKLKPSNLLLTSSNIFTISIMYLSGSYTMLNSSNFVLFSSKFGIFFIQYFTIFVNFADFHQMLYCFRQTSDLFTIRTQYFTALSHFFLFSSNFWLFCIICIQPFTIFAQNFDWFNSVSPDTWKYSGRNATPCVIFKHKSSFVELSVLLAYIWYLTEYRRIADKISIWLNRGQNWK